MSETKPTNGSAQAAMMADVAMNCMRNTAELQSRLVSSWIDLMTHKMGQPAAIANWSLEAMRMTAESTLRNIEHCQDCARRAVEEHK